MLAAGADSFLLNPVRAVVRAAAAVERQPSYGVAARDTAIAPARRLEVLACLSAGEDRHTLSQNSGPLKNVCDMSAPYVY